jgi:hypothetical protein
MPSPCTAPAHCLLLHVVGEYFDHYLGGAVRFHGHKKEGVAAVMEGLKDFGLALTRKKKKKGCKKNDPPVQWSALDEASRLIMWDSVHNSLEEGHLRAQKDCVVLHLDHFFLPEKLACALVHFHKLQQRSHRPPPPFPHLAELVFTPRQLQRFPRSCVLLTARRLSTTAGSFATRNSFWIDRIVVRFSSGLVKKVEVRPPKGGLCMCI